MAGLGAHRAVAGGLSLALCVDRQRDRAVAVLGSVELVLLDGAGERVAADLATDVLRGGGEGVHLHGTLRSRAGVFLFGSRLLRVLFLLRGVLGALLHAVLLRLPLVIAEELERQQEQRGHHCAHQQDAHHDEQAASGAAAAAGGPLRLGIAGPGLSRLLLGLRGIGCGRRVGRCGGIVGGPLLRSLLLGRDLVLEGACVGMQLRHRLGGVGGT